jgi:hypothetical protein
VHLSSLRGLLATNRQIKSMPALGKSMETVKVEANVTDDSKAQSNGLVAEATYRQMFSVVFCALVTGAAARAEVPQTFSDFLDRLLERGVIVDRFQQKRYVPGLARPFESFGWMRIDQSRSLEWVLCAPLKSTFRITRDQAVEVVEGEKVQALSPLKKRVLGVIRDLLSGDAARVNAVFKPQYLSSGDSFSLNLTPRNMLLASNLERITIEGDTRPVKVTIIFRQNDSMELSLESGTEGCSP